MKQTSKKYINERKITLFEKILVLWEILQELGEKFKIIQFEIQQMRDCYNQDYFEFNALRLFKKPKVI